MRTKLENVADSGDSSCGVGLERPLLQPLGGVAKNEVIDFGRREPGDLDRRVQQDQFFKLDLQRVEIPVSIFRQAIDGKPHDALLARCIDRDANLDGV